jgi:hypothetical protein
MDARLTRDSSHSCRDGVLDCQVDRSCNRMNAYDVAGQRIARMRTLDQRVVRGNDAGAQLVVRQLVERLHAIDRGTSPRR